jgi:hypothetical protein
MLAVIHILCETNPPEATAVVNGLLAWATMLGGFTALGSGLAAASLALVRRSRQFAQTKSTVGSGRASCSAWDGAS